MHFKIQITIVDDKQEESRVKEVISLEKSNKAAGLVGLSLSESKEILYNLQKIIVQEQAESYTKTHKNCPFCQKKRNSKGYHNIQYLTLFGTITIPSLRGKAMC